MAAPDVVPPDTKPGVCSYARRKDTADGPHSWLDGVGSGEGWRIAVPSLSSNCCIANHMPQWER